MKKAFTYLFVMLVSALVFYGGAGVNVISYCCDQCRSAGIEAVSDHKCCEIHHHHHEHETPVEQTCNDCVGHTHNNCCGIERLLFDWDTTTESNIDLAPISLDVLFAGTGNISSIPTLLFEEITSVMPTGPPLKTPRVYLSLLTTLLI